MKKVNILSLDFLREWLGIYFPSVTVWIPLPSVEVSDEYGITVLDIYYARFKVRTGQGDMLYVIILVEEQKLIQTQKGKLKLVQKVRVEVGKTCPYVQDVYNDAGMFEGYLVKLPEKEPELYVRIEAVNEQLSAVYAGPARPGYRWLLNALTWFERLAKTFADQLGVAFKNT